MLRANSRGDHQPRTVIADANSQPALTKVSSTDTYVERAVCIHKIIACAVTRTAGKLDVSSEHDKLVARSRTHHTGTAVQQIPHTLR